MGLIDHNALRDLIATTYRDLPSDHALRQRHAAHQAWIRSKLDSHTVGLADRMEEAAWASAPKPAERPYTYPEDKTSIWKRWFGKISIDQGKGTDI